MFLLIYKCRIAVSVRGKWFWKAWHCKLSLSDRLSAPADQKMPQSMMSDRQANSPGGQTLLPHFQTPERRELCGFGKVAGHTGMKAGGLTFRAHTRRSERRVMLMADEILANLGRLIREDHCNEDVMRCHCGALWEHGRFSAHVSVIKFALYSYFFPPLFFLPPGLKGKRASGSGIFDGQTIWIFKAPNASQLINLCCTRKSS